MNHEVRVVQVGEIRKHPNADALGLTEVLGYTLVVRLDSWKEGVIAVFVEPDYILPPGPPWDGYKLREDRRVRNVKLRGVYSPGLLCPLSDLGLEGLVNVGDNVMDRLGITRYVDDGPLNQGEEVPHPSLSFTPRSRLESWQKSKHLLAPDLEVQITEKINGKSGKWAWRDGRMWCGSREQWLTEDSNTDWWTATKNCPWLVGLCKLHQDLIFYGEAYGNQNKFKYGLDATKIQARLFYAFKPSESRWLNSAEFWGIVPETCRVPLLYNGPLSGANVEALAEGKSLIYPGQVREGAVVVAWEDAYDPMVGRIALKCVGNGYLERS